MKVIQGRGAETAKITVVCCLHGDEIFGLKVFKFFAKHIASYPRLKLILANEPAIKAKKRFIDQDLNRSFPGSRTGNKEVRLARELMKVIGKTEYLLDIHTTTSDIKMTPITASLTKRVQNIINLCASREVAYIKKPLAEKSLIGQYAGSASLEFNERYAKKDIALKEIRRVVDNLLHNKKVKMKKRSVFHIDGAISKNIPLPKRVANFKLIPELGVYPFLLYEKSYKDIHAFSAKRKKTMAV